MPAGMRNAGAGIRCDVKAVSRHRRRAFDDQATRGVIETQKIEFCSRSGVENVGKGHLGWRRKRRHSHCLDGNIEGMLGQTGWQHV